MLSICPSRLICWPFPRNSPGIDSMRAIMKSWSGRLIGLNHPFLFSFCGSGNFYNCWACLLVLRPYHKRVAPYNNSVSVRPIQNLRGWFESNRRNQTTQQRYGIRKLCRFKEFEVIWIYAPNNFARLLVKGSQNLTVELLFYKEKSLIFIQVCCTWLVDYVIAEYIGVICEFGGEYSRIVNKLILQVHSVVPNGFKCIFYFGWGVTRQKVRVNAIPFYR
jgi:hypothetical protein